MDGGEDPVEQMNDKKRMQIEAKKKEEANKVIFQEDGRHGERERKDR